MANAYGPNKARIFDEALRLVQEKGFAGLSMRNLADRLHIKASSLYKHISGKDEVVAHLQQAGLQSFSDSLKKAGNSKKSKVLAYRKWAMENPNLYELTFRQPLLRRELPFGLEEGITSYVIELAGKDHEHARAVWALLHGLVDLELMGRFPSNANMNKTWQRAIELL